MKTRVDFWTYLLIEFWKVFGRGLEIILAPKINEKSLEKMINFLIDFLMVF